MTGARKNSIIAVVLLALMTLSAGCHVYDDHHRRHYGRYDRWDRYDRDDRDRDGRRDRWERYSDRYYDRDDWRHDRFSDSKYRDRFDR